MLACVLLAALDAPRLRRLLAVTPVVSARGNAAFLDLRGTERLYPRPADVFATIRRTLHPERPLGMALAPRLFTAEIAARTAGEGRAITVSAGDEALFLSRRPLALLPLSKILARRLQPLGLQTLGDFASLPVSSVERRYGAEGLAMHRLARGEDEAALVPIRPGDEPCVLALVDPPAVTCDALCASLGETVEKLASLLQSHESGVGRLRLACRLDPARDVEADEVFGPGGGRVGDDAVWDVTPAHPEARAALLLDLLRLQVERAPPGGAVVEILLRALDVQPLATHQRRLFDDVTRDPARRSEALSRLAAAWGAASTRRPRLRAEHLLERRWRDAPDEERDDPRASTAGARADRASAIVRVLDRPEELLPVLVGGRLCGFRRGREAIVLARLSPPRRLEGGWWKEPWARDEYDLVAADGAVYRICRDMPSRRWLLLGEID